jgi:hypothetical protein
VEIPPSAGQGEGDEECNEEEFSQSRS